MYNNNKKNMRHSAFYCLGRDQKFCGSHIESILLVLPIEGFPDIILNDALSEKSQEQLNKGIDHMLLCNAVKYKFIHCAYLHST